MSHLVKLAALALDVSNVAPARFGKFGVTCYVRRDLVELIRAQLTAAGIDWRAERDKYRAKLKEEGRRR